MGRQIVTILGATGSIGINCLDVIAREPEKFQVYALTANTNWKKLLELTKQFQPSTAVCVDEQAAEKLSEELARTDLKTQVLYGNKGLESVASANEVDTVMASIVGAAGLLPTLAAVKAGKKILLANKESLVMAGELFMSLVQQHQALLLPVDSEHNALFQCLPNHHYPQQDPSKGYIAWHDLGVEKLILTASGGPFLNEDLGCLANKTPEQACSHPNWEMGRKISVDSATLMNKGLEVIEASYLYGINPDKIEVVVHPQSIIHSMVSYRDGSVLAELGNPDMRTPIAHVLAWPERIYAGVKALELTQIGRLDFQAPDHERFPCLKMAFEALEQGGTAPAILNAANEVAVEAFLQKRLPFTGISELVAVTLDKSLKEQLKIIHTDSQSELEHILETDTQTRKLAWKLLDKAVGSSKVIADEQLSSRGQI